MRIYLYKGCAECQKGVDERWFVDIADLDDLAIFLELNEYDFLTYRNGEYRLIEPYEG